MKLRIFRDGDGKYVGVAFECPGCGNLNVIPTDWTPPDMERSPHMSKTQWKFDGDLESPTLSPSILTRYTWGPEQKKVVCHSYVRKGRIQFLGDCTHELRGKTVDLPEVAEPEV